MKPGKMVASALVLVAVSTTSGFAQGFDEGSFDNPGTAAVNQPAASGGSDVGGFDESSFEGDGYVPGTDSALPSPTGTPDPGSVVVAPVPSDGGGFDDGSFEDGGNVVATPGGSTPRPAGGDDFPGGTTLPQPGGSEGVVEVSPQPDLPSPNGQIPTPNATPPAPQVDPQITAVETRDFGVPPQNTLRQGQFHAPTPVAIPGANLVTTASLVEAMNGGMQMVLIDVLGADYSIPGAFAAQGLAAPGNFQDRTQQQAAAWLGQITNGNRNLPIVIFCSDPMCWLSYNASLRTVNAGYSNVYWYRGGLQAWQMAGLPLHPAGF